MSAPVRTYRIGFFLAVGAAILLGAAAAYFRYHPRMEPAPSSLAPAPGQLAPAPEAEPALQAVQLTPQRLQSIGVKTGVVQMKDVHDDIRTVGNVDVDETHLATVETRFSGWIQRVYADATYQVIRKGQPLFTIYSPDVVTTEQEYLLAKQNRDLLVKSSVPGVASGAESLLGSAVERLRQWEIPQREIERVEQTGSVRREMEIDSPVSGFITERNALPNMFAQPGTKLYTVADLSTVWVYIHVFQNDIGRVKIGDRVPVTVDAWPGRVFAGRVNTIWPEVEEATRTAKVRIEIPNPDMRLSLGMFVNATLHLPLGRRLVIPASGVFHSGTRQIAFIDRGDGYLEPREIETGEQAGDEVVILKGLSAGEHIVTSANFLIDSESQIQAAMGSFAPPPPGAGAAAAMNAPGAQAALVYTTVPSPPHAGGNTFQVKLTGADGKPVSGAQVTVTYFMAAMPAMGMAAMRTVATLPDKGNGLYEGPGQVETGGTWQVTVLATRNGQTLAQKQLEVSAAAK